MKKKTIKKRILAGLLAFSLIVPANVAEAKTQTVLETNVTEASEGCTLVGVYGSYFAQAKEALAKINEIRKEACEAGNIRDPRNSGRYLQPSDYVPLKWSSDLEYIARIRAAEAGIAILAIVFGIAFVVARDIQRWRDQTEFLEDIMQVLGDKDQN